MSTAITLQTQADVLQLDLAESIEQILSGMDAIITATNLRDALVTDAAKITVTDADSYVKATDATQALKIPADEFAETLDPFVSRAFKLHRALTAYKAKVMAPIEEQSKRLKREREVFAAEQERMRREAALKAQQEAQKREEARLIEEARQAAAQGDSASAQAILEEAINVEVAPVVLPSITPAIQGTSFRSVWEYVILDPTKLKAEFLIVNEKAIGATVRAMHKTAETLCGAGSISVNERKIVIDK